MMMMTRGGHPMESSSNDNNLEPLSGIMTDDEFMYSFLLVQQICPLPPPALPPFRAVCVVDVTMAIRRTVSMATVHN